MFGSGRECLQHNVDNSVPPFSAVTKVAIAILLISRPANRQPIYKLTPQVPQTNKGVAIQYILYVCWAN